MHCALQAACPRQATLPQLEVVADAQCKGMLSHSLTQPPLMEVELLAEVLLYMSAAARSYHCSFPAS